MRFIVALLSTLFLGSNGVLASDGAILKEIIENNRESIEESDFKNKKLFLIYSGISVEKIVASPPVNFSNQLGVSTGIVEAVNPEESQKQVLFEFQPEARGLLCSHEKRINKDGSYGAFIDIGETYGKVKFSGKNWLTKVSEGKLENCITTAFLSFYGVEYEVKTPEEKIYGRKILSLFSECASSGENADAVNCVLAHIE